MSKSKNAKKVVISWKGKTREFDSMKSAASFLNIKQCTLTQWNKGMSTPEGMIIKVENKDINW